MMRLVFVVKSLNALLGNSFNQSQVETNPIALTDVPVEAG